MGEMGAQATSICAPDTWGCPARSRKIDPRRRIELEGAQKISRGKTQKNLKKFGPELID